MIERRTARRKRVIDHGMALVDNWTAIDCTLHDVSETGARLTFREPIILPKQFKLRWMHPRQDFDVTVVWQKDANAGIQFASPSPELRDEHPWFLAKLFASRA